MMRDLVADRSLDLRPQKRRAVAEIPLEGVLVDHDAIRKVVASDRPADVHPIRANLAAPPGDDHRSVVEESLEIIRKLVQRLHDELVELTRFAIRRRQLCQELTAIDEPSEFRLGKLIPDQGNQGPAGEEDDGQCSGENRDQALEPGE